MANKQIKKIGIINKKGILETYDLGVDNAITADSIEIQDTQLDWDKEITLAAITAKKIIDGDEETSDEETSTEEQENEENISDENSKEETITKYIKAKLPQNPALNKANVHVGEFNAGNTYEEGWYDSVVLGRPEGSESDEKYLMYQSSNGGQVCFSRRNSGKAYHRLGKGHPWISLTTDDNSLQQANSAAVHSYKSVGIIDSASELLKLAAGNEGYHTHEAASGIISEIYSGDNLEVNKFHYVVNLKEAIKELTDSEVTEVYNDVIIAVKCFYRKGNSAEAFNNYVYDSDAYVYVNDKEEAGHTIETLCSDFIKVKSLASLSYPFNDGEKGWQDMILAEKIFYPSDEEIDNYNYATHYVKISKYKDNPYLHIVGDFSVRASWFVLGSIEIFNVVETIESTENNAKLDLYVGYSNSNSNSVTPNGKTNIIVSDGTHKSNIGINGINGINVTSTADGNIEIASVQASNTANGIITSDDYKKLSQIGTVRTITNITNINSLYSTHIVTIPNNTTKQILEIQEDNNAPDNYNTKLFIDNSNNNNTLQIIIPNKFINIYDTTAWRINSKKRAIFNITKADNKYYLDIVGGQESVIDYTVIVETPASNNLSFSCWWFDSNKTEVYASFEVTINGKNITNYSYICRTQDIDDSEFDNLNNINSPNNQSMDDLDAIDGKGTINIERINPAVGDDIYLKIKVWFNDGKSMILPGYLKLYDFSPVGNYVEINDTFNNKEKHGFITDAD